MRGSEGNAMLFSLGQRPGCEEEGSASHNGSGGHGGDARIIGKGNRSFYRGGPNTTRLRGPFGERAHLLIKEKKTLRDAGRGSLVKVRKTSKKGPDSA